MGVVPGVPLAIPDFNHNGVLPPFLGSTPVIPAMMSPYLTTLRRVADKLCGTSERKEIFKGLLKFRDHLNGLGFTDGFQWLSGSFMEDIETIEGRAPRDIDVVTFSHRPPAVKTDAAFQLFMGLNSGTMNFKSTRANFKCDAYYVDLDVIPTTAIVDQTRYWFGLFSHRRTGVWKGMLQVPLIVGQADADAAKVVGA
jgi:hypothetical protein